MNIWPHPKLGPTSHSVKSLAQVRTYPSVEISRSPTNNSLIGSLMCRKLLFTSGINQMRLPNWETGSVGKISAEPLNGLVRKGWCLYLGLYRDYQQTHFSSCSMDEETTSSARLRHDQPYSTRLSPPLDYRNTQASSLSANVPELDRRDSRRRLGQGGGELAHARSGLELRLSALA